MKKLLKFISIIVTSITVYAQPINSAAIDCSNLSYLDKNPQLILSCAQKTLPTAKEQWTYLGKVESDRYTRYRYTLNSVTWPWNKNTAENIIPTQWNNVVDIYVPVYPTKAPAFVYIDGGYNYDKDGNPLAVSKAEPLFDNILQRMGAANILIDIKYLPTQYLNINGMPKKEDAIIAYTWNKFINDPANYIYHPLHLPMQVAVSQSMTLAQKVLKEQRSITIDKFVIAGASKRGWTTWMTALADDRVVGAIPMVIDVLNSSKQFPHIFATYGQHWPIALIDYYQESITQYLNPDNPLYPNYLKLMTVEDPYAYLTMPQYREKLKRIPKYIINSSGDDFFPADGSRYYFTDLPGSTTLLSVPNSPHNIGQSNFADKLASSITAYYWRLVRDQKLPFVHWFATTAKNTRVINATVDELPVKATLWVASNKITRDFRYACNIRYLPVEVPINPATRQISTSYKLPDNGWNAGFLELDFADGLVTSSPVYIDPDTYPSKEQIMPQQGGCLLIPDEHVNKS